MKDSVSMFLTSYQDELKHSVSLPKRISDQFELYDCLHATEVKSTYIIRNKDDNTLAVLKVAAKSAQSDLKAEYQILSTVHAPTFPQAVSFFSDAHMDYLVRSYIVGYPVSYYIEKNGPFSESESIRLVSEVCRALSLLHAQTPPIIHRDIKPQNVIFTPERTLVLIDFDTVRHYQLKQKKDTTFLGTATTAAPEQYGYKQTDQRSDIYSTGILLLYLCTGSYELESCASIHNRKLAHVIETCTRFDPDRRYMSIRQLQIHLERALNYEKRSTHSFLLGATLGLAAGCGLAITLYVSGVIPLASSVSPSDTSVIATALATSTEVPNQITFESPLIEQAVRKQLGYSADTPLHQSDLDRITELYIIGEEIITNWPEVTYDAINHGCFSGGSIQSLIDIPKLRNLTNLAICNQSVVDLSPLRGMPIIRLALNGNQITDISALADLPYLIELYIGSNPLVRIDALRDCKYLHVFDLDSTGVVDLSPVSGYSLESVYLRNTPNANYEPLFNLSSLKGIAISDITQSELESISKMVQLTYLDYRGTLPDVTPLFHLKNLTSFFLIDDALTSLDGIESLTQLQNLYLSSAPNIDLTPLIQLPNLNSLDIASQELSDYSTIIKLKNLEKLFCKAEEKASIEEKWPDVNFEFFVY